MPNVRLGVNLMTLSVTGSVCRSLILITLLASSAVSGAEKSPKANQLRVAVVQLALANTIASNRDRIVSRISDAAAMGARVVVLPEGALRGDGDDDKMLVEESIDAIRQAAHKHNVYVL